MALAVVLVSTVAACFTAGIGASRRARHAGSTIWWLTSTFILVLPVVLVFGPLG
jgi:hypothetical protein